MSWFSQSASTVKSVPASERPAEGDYVPQRSQTATDHSESVTPVASQSSDVAFCEHIPAAPSVSDSVTTDTVATIAGAPTQLEQTLVEMGLGGFSPSGMAQHMFDMFHTYCHLPWWAAIFTGTFIIRLCLIPLVVKSQRSSILLNNIQPQIREIQTEIDNAKMSGDFVKMTVLNNKMVTVLRTNNVKMTHMFLVPLAQLPIFISVYFGLRGMANLPIPSLSTGGLWWFSDMTVADPYCILPLITSLTLYITLEYGTEIDLKSMPNGNMARIFIRMAPISVFICTLNFPSAMLCYWVTSNTLSLTQALLFRVPAIRGALGLPARVSHQSEEKPLLKGIRDGWKEKDLIRELKNRRQTDDRAFKEAGFGPVPKTYKENPLLSGSAQDSQSASRAIRN